DRAVDFAQSSEPVRATLFAVDVQYDTTNRLAGWHADQRLGPECPPSRYDRGVGRCVMQPVFCERALAPISLPLAREDPPRPLGIPDRRFKRRHETCSVGASGVTLVTLLSSPVMSLRRRSRYRF